MRKYVPNRAGKQPESKTITEIRNTLHNYEWMTIKMHGNLYQAGFPDLFCCHSRYGIRLIEGKRINEKGHLIHGFTAAQRDRFPKLCANGAGVWVMIDGSEAEYAKLFEAFNWWKYLRVL